MASRVCCHVRQSLKSRQSHVKLCFPALAGHHKKYSKMSSSSKYLDFDYCDASRSGFSVRISGWSIDDVNILALDLTQPHYLRTFRIFRKLEQLREMAKGQGFLDILEFEKTQATYMKCLDLERCLSAEDLHRLPGAPYAYDLIVECRGGRIGKSSFQIDNFVRIAETGTTVYRGALVYVTVDYTTKQPIPNPQDWVDKFQVASKSAQLPGLRLSLQNPRGTETVLHRSHFKVRFAEVDRFGHTNNTALYEICADSLLECHSLGRLPAACSLQQFEAGLRRLEVDFVGESGAGDTLTACVTLDSAFTHKLFCKLYNKDRLIYVQGLEYDFDICVDPSKL